MKLKSMKKSSLQLILFAGVLAGLMSCSGRVEPTSVEIKDPVRHYYPIPTGDELLVIYEVTNTGNRPLVISEIQTSCGCIAYDDSKRIIPPGAQQELRFRYDSFKNLGYVRHQIRLYGNFESGSSKVLEFDVDVIPPSDHPRDYEELYFETNRSRNLSPAASSPAAASRSGYYVNEPD